MSIIGLDLGKYSFRAVEIEKTKKGVLLKNFGAYENPKLNFDHEDLDDLQIYSDALHNFFSEIGFSTPHIIGGLEERNIFMRIIKMPKITGKDLKNSVMYHAEQYLPFPAKDMRISWQEIEGESTKEAISVQLVATKNSVSERYEQLLRSAHLIPDALEPETLAVARLFGDSEETKVPTLILNIGRFSTYLVVTYGGIVRFTRSISMGGDDLTKAVQQGLDLDQLKAEEYKKVYGLDKSYVDGKVYEALRPMFENLVLEINRSMMFFTTQYPGATIKRVVLCGGTALMPGLILYMANTFDAEVSLANPWVNVEISQRLSKQQDYLKQHGPEYAVAVGLAMRGL